MQGDAGAHPPLEAAVDAVGVEAQSLQVTGYDEAPVAGAAQHCDRPARVELVHARPELVELGPGDILLPGNAAATETGHGRGDRARFDQRVRV